MRNISWMSGALLALAVAPAFSADCVADLSGDWSRDAAPDASADAAYRAPGSGWSDRIRVIRDAGRVIVESMVFTRGDMQPPLRFTYLPGGGVTENAVMMGRGLQKQASEARWDGCRLVIVTHYPADGDAPAGTVTQTLWLDAAALVVETARGDSGPDRTIYRRAAVAGGT